MRRRLVLLLGLSLLFLPELPAKKREAVERPAGLAPGEVELVRGELLSSLDATLPGRLVSYALPRGAGGARTIYLLVRPLPAGEEQSGTPEPRTQQEREGQEQPRKLPPCPGELQESAADAPLRLYRLETSGSGSLELLRDRLPYDATQLDSVDLDGDGEEELWIARPGELTILSPLEEGGDRVVLSDPDLELRNRDPRIVRLPELAGRPFVSVTGFGVLRLFGPRPGSERFEPLAQILLPSEASLRPGGFRIRSRGARIVGRKSDGSLLFATPVDVVGKRRLKTEILTLTPAGQTERQECWARHPEAEDLLESEFLMLDDEPILMASTKRAGKLALFGEKRLRLYPLRPDRSRLGFGPLFAVESRMNLWQSGDAQLIDVDRDGRKDLVVGYWKGLRDSRVVLDVYLRKEDGSFRASARTTAFDVEEGNRSFVEYGRDLDGDTLPDLVLQSGDDLRFYPGMRAASGSKLVAGKRASLSLARLEPADSAIEVSIGRGGATASSPGRPSAPRFADLDGDGREELLILDVKAQGASALRIVWLAAAPGQ